MGKKHASQYANFGSLQLNIRKKLMILLLPAPFAPNNMLTSFIFKVIGLLKSIDVTILFSATTILSAVFQPIK